MPLMNDTNGPAKQAGKAGAIGFLAQKMIGGLAKKKQQVGASPPGLAQRTIGQPQQTPIDRNKP